MERYFLIFIIMTHWILGRFSPEKRLNIITRAESRGEVPKIVPMEFCYVPDDVKFRYRQLWWTKKNFKSAVSQMGKEEEIDCDAPVGVILKDIPEYKRQYILQI
jgi:hypothetical protein